MTTGEDYAALPAIKVMKYQVEDIAAVGLWVGLHDQLVVVFGECSFGDRVWPEVCEPLTVADEVRSAFGELCLP